MNSVLLLYALSAFVIGGICGPYSETAEDSVVHLLSSSSLDDLRNELGVAASELPSLEYLSDESTCDLVTLSAQSQGIGFDTEYLGFRYVFFRSNKFYYLVAIPAPRPDGLLELGLLPLHVMNSSYQIVGGYWR